MSKPMAGFEPEADKSYATTGRTLKDQVNPDVFMKLLEHYRVPNRDMDLIGYAFGTCKDRDQFMQVLTMNLTSNQEVTDISEALDEARYQFLTKGK